MQLAAGITLPFPEKIREEFQVYEHCIRFHISFEKIGAMLDEFLAQLQEPLFVVLQLPLSRQEEEALRMEGAETLHQKVCYLDGQTKGQVQEILRQHGELLLNDGISQFGIASHATHDEMFIQKYKLIDIYCGNPQAYYEFLKKYGLVRTDKLLTAWDTFSRKTPGEARSIQINGIRVYEVYDELVKQGMYEAKIIED